MGAKTILIVDNIKDDRKHLKRLLRDYDAEVLEASSGLEVLELLKRKQVHCLIVSQHLQDQSGPEFLEKLKSHEISKHLSLILALSEDHQSPTEHPQDHGVHDLLIKGKITKEIVTRAIEASLERVQLQFELEIKQEDLRQSQGLWRSLFENAPDFIVIVDQDFKIRLANKSWGEVSPDSLIGKSVFEIIPEYYQDAIGFSISNSFERAEASTIEVLGPEESGKQTYFETRVAPIFKEKTVTSVVLISRDITEKKKNENEIISQRYEALKASKIKSEFLANMSHEIRTPLNCIIGSADLLSETGLTPEQEKYVNLFQNAGKHLLQLINDILDLSKIEAGALNLNVLAFEVEALLKGVADFGQVFSQQKKLKFVYKSGLKTDIVALGDPDRIRQILLNLINNAIKFTEKGEIVLESSMEAVDSESSNFVFSIMDSGIGIPDNKLQEIFENFTQADKSVTRKYGGTGLGLSISKKLIQKMNGKIDVTSKLGAGSCFSVRLRLPTKTVKLSDIKKDVQRSKTTSVKHRNLNILVAEDLPDNRVLLQAYLKDPTFKVDYVDNGQKALEAASVKKYDLILMDMEMPVMDGYSATSEIRDNEKLMNRDPVPIIALTAHSFQEHFDKAKAAGCSHYLTKPFRKADLLKLIDEVSHLDSKKTA